METCRVTFYDIERCGYYQRGAQHPSFCTVQATLNELKSWAFQNGMTLGETCTFSPEEYNEDFLETYCLDLINHNSDNYLLVTWNRIPTIEGQVASVPSAGTVGAVEVDLTELPEGSIPGYETYFWFIPSRNVFACLQFQHTRLNGRKNLDRYLREFLAKKTSYVVTQQNPNNGDTDISGYARNTGAQTQLLIPQFSSQLHRRSAEVKYIREHREQIRKIIKKDTLSLDIQKDLAAWQKFLVLFGVQPRIASESEKMKFKLEMNYNPSEVELEEIIDQWQSEAASTGWNDTGFQLERESKIRWLSHDLARQEIELDIIRRNDGSIDSETLLKSLIENRDSLLNLLDFDGESKPISSD